MRTQSTPGPHARSAVCISASLAVHFAVSAVGLAIGAFGCADSPAIDGPPVHPGDSWLDRETDVRLLAISPTNLPTGIPESALRLLHKRTETVLPEDWVRAGETLWRYAPTLDFGLALGPQWLAPAWAPQALEMAPPTRTSSKNPSWTPYPPPASPPAKATRPIPIELEAEIREYQARLVEEHGKL